MIRKHFGCSVRLKTWMEMIEWKVWKKKKRKKKGRLIPPAPKQSCSADTKWDTNELFWREKHCEGIRMLKLITGGSIFRLCFPQAPHWALGLRGFVPCPVADLGWCQLVCWCTVLDFVPSIVGLKSIRERRWLNLRKFWQRISYFRLPFYLLTTSRWHCSTGRIFWDGSEHVASP